jgi:uncharacterized membrane protein
MTLTLTTIHLIAHITAGISTLIAGPIAIFYNFKNPRNHRLAGKIFFYAMLYVCISAVFGYLRRPDLVFYQFLLGIAVLVFTGSIRGVRGIQIMKGSSVRWADIALAVLLGLFGCWMLFRAVQMMNGDNPAFPILFSIFGMAALGDTYRSLKKYLNPTQVHQLDWYAMHVSSMLGAFTASTTAFTVNVAHFLPWYLQWFGPTLLLLPLQFYFGRKIKAWKKKQLEISAN